MIRMVNDGSYGLEMIGMMVDGSHNGCCVMVVVDGAMVSVSDHGWLMNPDRICS